MTLINYGQGIIELFTDPTTGAPVLDDRARFDGPHTMVLHPPVVPGVTEREFSFTYEELRGPTGKPFITTPPRCPSAGLWTSSLTYTVSTGASYAVTSTTPCTRHHRTRRGPGHRKSHRHHPSHRDRSEGRQTR